MEGVTDAPMRALLTHIGGFTHCVSEFLRVSQNPLSPRALLRHVPELRRGSRTPAQVPVHVQLLGGHPERLAQSALIAVGLGAPAIDLNFGCPAPTVNRHDGGATLLKYPERIFEIVREVRESVPLHVPVSAKLRLGWDDPEAIHRNAEAAQRGGANWITIHARTKEQGYRPPAHWRYVGEVRRGLDIPVIANGDLWSEEDFDRCREVTGCEHFMFGRGALADPTLVWRLSRRLYRQEAAVTNASQGWADWVRSFIGICGRGNLESERYLLARIKQWLRFAQARNQFPAWEQAKRAMSLADLMACL